MENEVLTKLTQIEQKVKFTDKPLPLIEACEYLNIKQSYMYFLLYKRRIVAYRPGGKKLYFLKADLDNYLLRNKQNAGSKLN